MKNQKVVIDFINGLDKTKTKNLFIEKSNNGISVLYSYGYHYPLCIKLLDNTFLINCFGYSVTTARHKSLLCHALNNKSFKELEKNRPDNIMFFNTNELKMILDKQYLSKSQLIEEKI